MAEACPRCQRPVAVARPTCLYCGAALEGAAPPLAPATANPSPFAGGPALSRPGPAPDATLVVLDLAEATAQTVARALGLTAYEADQRRRHGRYHLHRRLPPPEAEAEARRLREAGLEPLLVPEAEARTPPWMATGGGWRGEALVLRGDEGERAVRTVDLLLVVTGPIAREYQTSAENLRRLRTATLAGGHRFHLHLRSGPRPVELDPDAFDFADQPAASGSSLLRLRAWVDRLAAGIPHDDGFRRLTPALSPALPARWDAALSSAARTGAPSPKREASLVLDNLAQFRFHSGWRAAVERRRSP